MGKLVEKVIVIFLFAMLVLGIVSTLAAFALWFGSLVR